MKNGIIFFLLLISYSSLKSQDRGVPVKINVHSGIYAFGWNWFSDQVKSANRRASSGALIHGIELEIQFLELREKINLSTTFGYRDIYSNHFYQFEFSADSSTIYSIPQINHSHYLNLGLFSQYRVSNKHTVGAQLDFLFFLEREADFYMQQNIAANLDILYRWSINSKLSIGIETPIRVLPYAKWDTNISVIYNQNGHNADATFDPVKVRIGGAGLSFTLTCSI